MQKPQLAALSGTSREIGIKAGLRGWRCSAVRASLPQNSLLTGNLTGNFANSKLMTSRIQQETPVPQPFFSQFPTQKNREIILRNREFKRVIREKRAGECTFEERIGSVSF